MVVRKISSEERRAALKRRQQREVDNRDKSSGRGIFNLEVKDRGEVSWFALKTGRNLIDIIPYIISSDKHPDRNEGEKVCLPGWEDYKLEVWVHYNVGPSSSKVVCLRKTYGRRCPICEEAMNLGMDQKAKDALEPKRRVFYNVIDLDSDDQKIQIWEVSFHWGESRLLDESEYSSKGEEAVYFADLGEGKSIDIRGKEGSFEGKKYIEPASYRFVDRDIYGEEILDDSFPLDAMLIVPTYGEVEKLFRWVGEKEDSPSDESKKDGEEKEVTVDEEKCSSGYPWGEEHDEHDKCTVCSEEEYDKCAKKKRELDKSKGRRRRRA